MQHPDNTVATGFLSIQQAMRAARPSGNPAILVAASKGQPEVQLRQAIALGITHFGENRVQEAMGKWPALKAAHPELVLHLIGPLQSNKAKEAVALFDVIETIDREKIARAVAEESRKQGKHPVCLIQINTGEELQKGGVAPRELPALLHYCNTTANLPIHGLMCIPPAEKNPAPHFALMQQLAREYGLELLSMGMSGDFEIALRFGATHIRIGTRLFGAR